MAGDPYESESYDFTIIDEVSDGPTFSGQLQTLQNAFNAFGEELLGAIEAMAAMKSFAPFSDAYLRVASQASTNERIPARPYGQERRLIAAWDQLKRESYELVARWIYANVNQPLFPNMPEGFDEEPIDAADMTWNYTTARSLGPQDLVFYKNEKPRVIRSPPRR